MKLITSKIAILAIVCFCCPVRCWQMSLSRVRNCTCAMEYRRKASRRAPTIGRQRDEYTENQLSGLLKSTSEIIILQNTICGVPRQISAQTAHDLAFLSTLPPEAG